MVSRSRRWKVAMVALAVSAGLSGCATLPSSGPTGRQIVRSVDNGQNQMGYALVELDGPEALPNASTEVAEPPLIALSGERRRVNTVGVGDTLQVTVYEAGVALFSAGIGASPELVQSRGERLPPVTVDEDGAITLPYAGTVVVGGQTTNQVERSVAARLMGKSQAPQVLVSIVNAVSNAIIVSGEVAKPGRLALATNSETLADALALAGGYRGDPADLIVRLVRNGQSVEERLSQLARSELANLQVIGGDRITVLRDVLTFSAFGGPGRVDLIPFGKSELSLAEAIAKAGGSSANVGDPAAIFVFRYVADGNTEVPTIYHLNMMKPGSYFLSQKFAMRAGDVLYVGNAEANQPSKLLSIIGQIFTPIISVRTVTQ